jgi:hypothetical protein
LWLCDLAANYLNNKTWGSSKRKKASFKELGNFPGFKKGISRRNICFLEFETRNFRRNKIAKRKITHKTIIKIMVLMRDFLT